MRSWDIRCGLKSESIEPNILIGTEDIKSF